MATWKIQYVLEGDVDVEADSYEEAMEAFEELSDSTLIGNSYIGWRATDAYEA